MTRNEIIQAVAERVVRETDSLSILTEKAYGLIRTEIKFLQDLGCAILQLVEEQ